jgi:hypothetical protein
MGCVRACGAHTIADDPTAKDALDAASTNSTDSEKVESLAHELARAEGKDPEFGRQLQSLWKQAADEARAEFGGVVNKISGIVGGHTV